MTENDFDQTARAWLEDGPTRMSDRALLSALEEVHTTRQRRAVWPAWRATPLNTFGFRTTLQRLSMTVASGAAAIALVAVATVLLSNPPRTIEGPAAGSPTSPTSPTADPSTSGGMWPQSTLEEVRAAQERADAGDPDYTWQVAERWNEVDQFAHVELELVDRFLREVLGWEAHLFIEHEGGDFNVSVGAMDGWADGALTNQHYLRCAPGRTNPLYPPQPDSEQFGESCAPTLDDLRYESVRLDLAQLASQGRDGIWVVRNWRPTAFEQADPAIAEAQATRRLEEFLAARIAGRGAEGYVDVYADWVVRKVPLLYATTSGAPYERFEFERVDGPEWPYGGYITFSVRMFADDGATVVEQQIHSHWDGGRSVGIEGGLGMASITTENGQPVPVLHAQFDGEVTFSSPSPYKWHVGDDGFIDFTDPAVYWSDCEQGPAPADAAAFAQTVIADPNFESTAPVAARVGVLEAMALDVALAPAGRVCGPYRTNVHQWINALEPGKRLRLFLVDVPEGMSMRTLAITVMAPDARFDEVLAEAAPILDSIEFHVP